MGLIDAFVVKTDLYTEALTVSHAVLPMETGKQVEALWVHSMRLENLGTLPGFGVDELGPYYTPDAVPYGEQAGMWIDVNEFATGDKQKSIWLETP